MKTTDKQHSVLCNSHLECDCPILQEEISEWEKELNRLQAEDKENVMEHECAWASRQILINNAHMVLYYLRGLINENNFNSFS